MLTFITGNTLTDPPFLIATSNEDTLKIVYTLQPYFQGNIPKCQLLKKTRYNPYNNTL